MRVRQTSRDRLKNLLLLICLILSGCNSTAQPSNKQQTTSSRGSEKVEVAGEVIWSGDSAGVEITWTTTDLYTQSAAEKERVWLRLVQTGFDDFVGLISGNRADRRRTDRCSYERRFRVLSIVGRLVSFEDDYADDCGAAHPSADLRYTTIDLSRPGEVRYARQDDTPMTNVDLTKPGQVSNLKDYFNAQLILQALLADPIIQNALATQNRQKPPQNVAQLPELFAGNDYELGDTDVELRPDFLTRFAFHHLEGDKVAVLISLPPHSGAKQVRHKELGILLPIPDSLRQQFELAASRQQGFLMSDAEQIAGGRKTTFRLSTDAAGVFGK